jgi:hypothetical protein
LALEVLAFSAVPTLGILALGVDAGGASAASVGRAALLGLSLGGALALVGRARGRSAMPAPLTPPRGRSIAVAASGLAIAVAVIWPDGPGLLALSIALLGALATEWTGVRLGWLRAARS